MSVYKSSTGLDENIAAILCYLFAFLGAFVFVMLEKRSRFVLFHALQSIFLFVALMIGHVLAGFIPLLGPLLASLLTLAGLALWMTLLVRAGQGKWLKLPWVGELALRQARQM
ncbi:DUF4870 domain-containing protein [Paenibacillus farraposensis]|uniref:DUF4870 domain-containing protein n=1 Tax=Paenibacillus farraposensis TaxID=2807095 RepID=A0ABW4DAQ7_9BACL|nr:hypothetical protein [Paenibacillus farraposensis]MCC3379053.1 hypothetical protein [Paenibacillus farraposensis]